MPDDRSRATSDPQGLTPTTTEVPAQHYTDLGLLGRGGMGEVRRVHDRVLDRVLALKAVLPHRDASRFVAEARVTARLQHPGIIPVHEMGQLPDGRPYFTMKEVRGRALSEMIDAVHRISRETWRESPEGWTLRSLLETFLRVCETLAYAHAQGVIHRDLKPDNVMVGEFGEVLVVDWGLALVVGSRESAASTPEGSFPSQGTMSGSLSGTPAYMAPEQATEPREKLLPTADVWALGAMLYEVLTGRPPFGADEPLAVLGRLLTEAPAAFPPAPEAPDALRRIALRSLSRNPAQRFSDAHGVADAIRDWLQGADRQRRALEAVARADAIVADIAATRERAAALRDEAGARLEAIPTWESSKLKEPAWDLEEEAKQLDLRTGLAEVAWLRELHGALQHDPDLVDAHQRLADHYRTAHETAESHRDAIAAAANLELLRAHDRGRNARYLSGVGALSVVTEPAGARVACYRVVERHHRLEQDYWRELGPTPVDAIELPVGSYILVISHPGFDDVRLPVLVEREGHAAAIPPNETAVQPLLLPRVGELGPDDVLVPAGWFWCGGDPAASDAFPATRIWADEFVIRRFPVTVGEYAEFLRHLVITEGAASAVARAPTPPGRERSDGFMAPDGDDIEIRFDESSGGPWPLDWPVTQVDWTDARAFCDWREEVEGRPWRLPHELEWEKAARGVDRRFYAWGDAWEPSWAATVPAFNGAPHLTAVRDFPRDRSPYGVCGVVGNVRQWCGNLWKRRPSETVTRSDALPESGFLAVRGGLAISGPVAARCAGRYGSNPRHRFTVVGFRLAFSRQ